MKKNLLYLVLAGCTFFFGACNDDDNPFTPVEHIQIGSATVDFKAIGGEGSIEVDKMASALKAISNEEWCVINSCMDGTVNFTVAANTSLETRTAVITLSLGTASRKVGITQMGAIAEYDTTPLFAIFDNKPFKQFVRFTSDLPIETLISEGDESWIQIEEAAGGFYISGSENTETPEREALITITSGKMTQSYYFFQYSALSFSRVWDIHYLNADGEITTDKLSMVPTKEGVVLTMEKMKYQFMGTIDNGSLKIACGQSLGKMNKFDLVLAARSTAGELAIDPSLAFRLVPSLLENGKWGLTLKADESWNREIQSMAVWAVSNGQPAGFVQMFSNLSLEPTGEVVIPIETYELDFSAVNSAKRGGTRDDVLGECYVKIETDNWNTAIALDFFSNPDTDVLEEGTYTLGTDKKPFTIGAKSYLDVYNKYWYSVKFKSGTVVVAKEGNEYILNIDLIAEVKPGEERRIIGTYRGEIQDMGAPLETVQLNFADVNSAKRSDPRDPAPGECYVKIDADNWNVGLALDFFTEVNSKVLKEGTYTVSNSQKPFTIGSKSYLDYYPKYWYSVKFTRGTVQVSKEGKEYIFVIDLITAERKRIQGTFRKEIQDMGEEVQAYDLNITKIDGVKRIIPNNAKPGECYIKFDLNGWDIEMAINFFMDPAIKTLPEGTYIYNTNNAPFTFGERGYLTCYTKKWYTSRFKSGSVKVSKEGTSYVFNLDAVISYEGKDTHVVGLVKSEVTDMDNPQ